MIPSRQAHSLALALLLATGIVHAGTPAAASAESRFSEVSLCVAALERDVKSSLHAGPTSQEREQWQHRLESAFAHTGQAYLEGLSGEEGKRLLRSAESAVATWPASKFQPFAQSCDEQGRALLGQASSFQKVMIRKSAQRRLNRELAKLQGAASDAVIK